MSDSERRAVTRFEGRVYTHRLLWRTALDAGKRASNSDRDDHARLTAAVFCAFTVEAYLNLMIEQIDSEIFANERKHFRRDGVRGKLAWVEQRLSATPVADKAEQRELILQLFTLRDQLAHAKPIKYEDEIEHDLAVDPGWMLDQWVEEKTTPAMVGSYLRAVEYYVEWLHTHAVGLLADPHLKESALRGVLQSETGHTAAKLLPPS